MCQQTRLSEIPPLIPSPAHLPFPHFTVSSYKLPVKLQKMNIRYARSAFNRMISTVCLAGLSLSACAVFGTEEICSSCGQQVGISGDFGHRKDDATVTVEGAAPD